MKLFILWVLTTLPAIANGQVSINNKSLVDSTLPYFYIGVDNIVEIDWKKLKPADRGISINGGGGSITVAGENKFIVRVNRVTDDCFLKITNKKGDIIIKKMYKVRGIPLPQATLNRYSFDTITKEQILLSPLLNVIIPKCYLHHNFIVTSFHASFISNEESITTSSQSNHFSKEQLLETKKLNKGDKIYFSELRCVSPDSRITKLPPFWIVIK